MGKKNLKLSFFFFLFFILSFYSVSGVISGGFCKLTGCTYTGPVVFQSNVTVIEAGSVFINETLSLFDKAGTIKIVLNASGDSFFNSGDVGIGTTNPSELLEISSPGDAVLQLMMDSDNTGLNDAVIKFAEDGDAGAIWSMGMDASEDKIFSIGTGDTFNTNADFIMERGSVNALYIDATSKIGMGTSSPTYGLEVVGNVSLNGTIFTDDSGNVGIGTTSPAAPLHVQHTDVAGANPTTILSLGRDASSSIGDNNYFDFLINPTDAYARIGMMFPSAGDGELSFWTTTNTHTSLTEQMRIDKDGNVGIGTIAPSKLLTLNATTPELLLQSSASNDQKAIISMGDVQGNEFLIETDFFAHETEFQFPDSNTVMTFFNDADRITMMTAGGNVGIGTVSPLHLLDISEANDDVVSISSTRDVAGVANLFLRKRTAAGDMNDGDTVLLRYTLNSDTTGDAIIADVRGVAEDVTHATRQSGLSFHTQASGASVTTERMRIDSSGNVGINTTNPQALLHVAGAIHLQQLTDLSWVTGGTVRSSITGDSAGRMIFKKGSSTERMRIDEDGNVGIGTTTPNTLLDIASSLPAIQLNETDFGNNDYSIRVESGAFMIAETGAGAGEKFAIDGSAVGTLNITNSGFIFLDNDVGIGTTGPAEKLHVAGNVALAATGGYLRWGSGDIQIEEVAQYQMGFKTWNGSDLTEKMRIEGGGNVGIGTTSPSSLLNLKSPDGIALNLNIQSGHSNSVSTAAINFQKRNGVTLWQVGSNQVIGSAFEINEGAATNNRFSILVGGNVGIGTTTPAQKLEVVGSGNFTEKVFYEEIYGDMHFHNDSAAGHLVVIPAQNEWTNITGFGGNGMTTNFTNGFTFNPSLNALVCDTDMRISSWYKISTGNAGNNQEYQFMLAVNETRQEITDAHRKIGAAGDVGDASGGGSFRCKGGDYISLQTINKDGTADLNVHVSTVVLRRIGS